MARSDLLISLVKAGAAGDKNLLRATVDALVAEERAKSHHVVAERLVKALQNIAVTPPPFNNISIPKNDGKDIILEVVPKLSLDDLLLTLPARTEANHIVEEQFRAETLRSHGYEPRHKILLSGPPGNGKTSFAEAIAYDLNLPFFVVRYDALIGSYLGETNTRLRSLFDYIKTQKCVLFFDEFDSIGKERGDQHETGEIKRVVSFLLMQIDQLPSYVVTIAATNHAELLDKAVWRRFQTKINFPKPNDKEIAKLIISIFDSWPVKPKITPLGLAKKINASSYAEAKDFCQNIRRRNILGYGEKSIDDCIADGILLWEAQISADGINGERAKSTVIKTRSRTNKA